MEYKIQVNEQIFMVKFDETIPFSKLREITVNGERMEIDVSRDFSSLLFQNESVKIGEYEEVDGIPLFVEVNGKQADTVFIDEDEEGGSRKKKKDGTIKAPIPGTVVEVLVTEGQQVTEGEPVCILEAMKMQNKLTSPVTGTVLKVHTANGSVVAARDKLIEISAAEE